MDNTNKKLNIKDRSNKEKYEIHRVNDPKEKMIIKKKDIFNIPHKLLLVGKSFVAGKGTFFTNMLLKPEFYRNDFNDGEYIFIMSPSCKVDTKFKYIINELNIPDENVFTEWDDDALEAI